MAKIFFSYSHKDRRVRDDIDKHFAVLKKSKTISSWYDNEIPAGEDFDHAIKQELEDADIILLLISADFLNSNYCQDVEVKRALERQRSGQAKVVPIIVDVCDWKHSSIKHLKSLPEDGKEITKYRNRREAYQNITDAIRKLAKSVNAPIYQNVKQTLAKTPNQAQRLLSNFKEVISFTRRNIKLISLLLISVWVIKAALTIPPNTAPATESTHNTFHQLGIDINGDDQKDNIVFSPLSSDQEKPAELHIFLSPQLKNSTQPTIRKILGVDQIFSDTFLSKGKDGSLLVDFSELNGIASNQYTIKISYLYDSLRVTKYSLQDMDSNSDCHVNYLEQTLTVNGMSEPFPTELPPTLESWNFDLVPETCK